MERIVKNIRGERLYETEYGFLPSVTTIISLIDKPSLRQWTANITSDFLFEKLQKIQIKTGEKINFHSEEIKELFKEAKKYYDEYRKEAAGVGSEVHSLVENYIKSGGKNIPPEKNFKDDKVKNAFYSFLAWVKENNFIPLKSEAFIYSKIGYAGTLDCIGYFKNKKFLIDFKTSKGFYEGFPLQLSAYYYAYEERFNDKLEGMGILRLDKNTGLPFFKDYTLYKQHYFKMFKCLLYFWKLREKLDKVENADLLFE